MKSDIRLRVVSDTDRLKDCSKYVSNRALTSYAILCEEHQNGVWSQDENIFVPLSGQEYI